MRKLVYGLFCMGVLMMGGGILALALNKVVLGGLGLFVGALCFIGEKIAVLYAIKN